MARILIVEDVPAVLSSLTFVLEGDGHQIAGAEVGAWGLELMKTAAFDLVITDVWLPGLSGSDVM
jgi:two-component system response regulator RegX3